MRRDNWTKARWKKEAWKVFSKYIRTRDKGVCFTCDRRSTGQGYHAGHFAPQAASNMDARFNPLFVRGQCYHCNVNLSGNHIEYRRRLCIELGTKKVEDFENHYKRVSTGQQWQIKDFQGLITVYTHLLGAL